MDVPLGPVLFFIKKGAFHIFCHANAYFTLVNDLVLPGNCFLPCLLTLWFLWCKIRMPKTDTPSMHVIVHTCGLVG